MVALRFGSLLSRTIAVAVMTLLAACTTYVDSSPTGLVIANVTIVSPERTAPLEHGFVRIQDGRIAEVSERPLHGERRIDGTGKFLIPGLIDSHVHLALPPGFPAAMTAAQAAAHPDVVAATLAQDPKSYLFHGFTTDVAVRPVSLVLPIELEKLVRSWEQPLRQSHNYSELKWATATSTDAAQ